MGEKRIRILVAKPGLDGHDRGAKVIARAFRDAGFEVIYTGLRQTPEQIVNAALQEDADVVGLSVFGGIIPHHDIAKLKALGISEIFQPGASTEDIITYIRQHARKTV